MPNPQNINGDYRYAYNGMEVDNEVSGTGNSYTTEFRQYDPRLGRWKSLDPLMAKFPWMSPYVAFDNNPVYYIDPYGLEAGTGDNNPPGCEGDPPSNDGQSECNDGASQPEPTPVGKTPHGEELKKYSYDSSTNKWNTKNDWRLKRDPVFRNKMNQISQYGNKVQQKLSEKYGYTKSSSKEDISYKLYQNENFGGEYFILNTSIRGYDGKEINIEIPIARIGKSDIRAGENTLEKTDESWIFGYQYSNCFAIAAGIRGLIKNSSDFINIIMGKGYKMVKDTPKAGDIILINDEHAMVCVGKNENGKLIYKSKNLNIDMPIITGTFDEINAEQHGGDLLQTGWVIFRK